jgi:hypothetical protein
LGAPPQKTDCALFAACGRQTLRGFFDSLGGAMPRFCGDALSSIKVHEGRKSGFINV